MSAITDTSNSSSFMDEKSGTDIAPDREVSGPSSEKPKVILSFPPAPAPSEPDIEQQLQLRRFHLGLSDTSSSQDSIQELPWQPALDPAWFAARQPWLAYPLFLSEPAETEAGIKPSPVALPLVNILGQAFDSIDNPGPEGQILKDNFWRLAHLANQTLESHHGMARFWDIYHQVRESFLAEFAASDSAGRVLQDLMAQLEEHLPDQGLLLGLHGGTLLEIHRALIHFHRARQGKCFRNEIQAITARIADKLRLDKLHSNQGNSPESLFQALGGAAQGMIDMATLAKNLPSYRGSQSITSARRERLENLLKMLRTYLVTSDNTPDCILVHTRDLPGEFQTDHVECLRVETALPEARRVFEENIQELLPVIRAVRAARLEVNDAYRPDLHDEILETLTWHALSEEELNLAPPVIILESQEILHSEQLGAFSHIIHSGYPVQLLLTPHGAWATPSSLSPPDQGFHPGWGYLSVAHREAFVHQSTLVDSEHLVYGLNKMARCCRPAVALVDVPLGYPDDKKAWLQSRLAMTSRAHACFTYDPDAGESWAARFDLTHNPEPHQPWCHHRIHYRENTSDEKFLDVSITPVQWATFDVSWKNHFKVISRSAWSNHQIELAEYLESIQSPAPESLPFIWVVDEENCLQRAIITRSLALTCWDRYRHWRILQELGGMKNQYVEEAEAATRARDEAEFAREKQQLEEKHEAELARAKTEAAREAIDQLVALLVDQAGDPTALTRLPAETSQATVAEQAQAVEQIPPPQTSGQPTEATSEEEEEEENFDEAYIDTPLCTTCNDCTNLNPLLFKYNGNKQAYIADPKAGTFAELVKAAEKCPARCIHPGKPRPDDASVTDDLLKRAARFN